MIQLSEHARSILRAIADEKQIEVRSSLGWFSISHREALAILQGSPNSLRIAPETRTINGVTFAAPIDSDVVNYVVTVGGYGETRYFYFEDEKDRDTAYSAIIDALEGRTK